MRFVRSAGPFTWWRETVEPGSPSESAAESVTASVITAPLPLSALWLEAAVLGLGGYLLCQRWPRVGLLLVPLTLTLGLYQHLQLVMPAVGADMVRRLGSTYIWQAHVAHALILGGPLVGVLMGRRRIRLERARNVMRLRRNDPA